MSSSIQIDAQNNADLSFNIEASDAETNELLDFAGAEIVVQVKDADNCLKLDASTANGKITLPSTGVIAIRIPDDDMRSICAGQYKIGGVYRLNGETVSLFTGSVSVSDGVARI